MRSLRFFSIFAAGLLLGFMVMFSSYAQEQLTITTYYPSPSGAYSQLMADSLGVGDNDGDGNIDSGDAPEPTSRPGDIWVLGSLGIGTTDPGEYALYIDITGTNNSGSDAAYISGNVEIDNGDTEITSGDLTVSNGDISVPNGDINTDAASYPDYVFEADYERLSLPQLKEFIMHNKHLPGMPSAETAKKEGIGMFEQNRLILEKLEEAYLYIIELEEKVIELGERLDSQS